MIPTSDLIHPRRSQTEPRRALLARPDEGVRAWVFSGNFRVVVASVMAW
jgi:hypothetical protein